jgi:hypothetical protein
MLKDDGGGAGQGEHLPRTKRLQWFAATLRTPEPAQRLSGFVFAADSESP